MPAAQTGARRSGLGAAGWAGLGILALAIIGALTGQGSPSPIAAPTPTPGSPVSFVGQPTGRAATPGSSPNGASPTPASTGAPKSTSKPGPKPTPKPTPKPGPTPTPLTVKVTSAPGSVSRNSYASITVRTRAGASCSIEVDYASGPSSAAGLGTKKANSSGYVTWTWKIGGNTTKGTWPIYISCSSNGQHARTTSKVTVV